MNNLFEMMMQAQGGNAMQNLARQFGLAPEQAQSAVAAMLPAFQLGLQKQTESIESFQQMMRMMGGGNFAAFHDAVGDRIPDEAAEKGKDVVGQLFGGEEVARAVAAQAAMMSGISDQVIKQMMPVVASLVMGGLFKGAMNNGLGGLFGQAMPGGFGGMFGPMMGGQPPSPQATNPFANNPMADMIGQMIGGMMGQRPAPPPQDPMSAGLAMLRGMFDSGQQLQRSQMDAFQAIFQQFSGRR